MNQPYHYIGLDIHKRTVAFCEKCADGKKVASGTFRTDAASVARWARERTTPWIGGMEATIFTGYLYDALSPYAVELLVGHPLSIKAISSAKHKNDSVDAETLSNLLRADLFPESYMASPRVRALRRALRFRNFLVRMAVAMKNKTTGILWKRAFPTRPVEFMGSGTSKSSSEIWTRCPNSSARCFIPTMHCWSCSSRRKTIWSTRWLPTTSCANASGD